MWQKREYQDEQITHVEPMGKRKRPWAIDVLLYPMTVTGVVNLCVFVGVPMLMNMLVLIKHFTILVGLYVIWYLVECVKSSAGGGLRAPRIAGSWNENLPDAIVTYICVMAVYILCFVPMIAYNAVVEQKDVFYWLLLAYGVWIFPMLVLSVILFHFAAAWNPVKLVRRIFRVFGKYFILCLGLFAFLVVLHFVPSEPHILISIGLRFAILYVFMIFAHLIGRLYYNNKDKLDWF